MATERESVSEYEKPDRKHPEWYPYPPGIIMAVPFGSLAIMYLIGAFAWDQWGWGLVALPLGALAIFEVGTASYTAGMRRESHAQHLRREDERSLRATRPGISVSREGVREESSETTEE